MKKRMKFAVAIVAVIIVVLLTSVSVWYSFFMTSGTLYERYNTGDNTGISVSGNLWKAQTFTVGNTGANIDHSITSVKLEVRRVNLPGVGTVAIYATYAGKPTGTPLCYIDSNFDNLPEGLAEWVEFTFTTTTTSSADTMYAIVVSAPSGDSDNYCSWRLDMSSPTYTGGTFLSSSNGGVSWSLNTGYDFMFEVYGVVSPGLPDPPSNPNPTNNNFDVNPYDVDLSWDADGAYYDVYFGTSLDPPLYFESFSDTTINVGDLEILEDYYWKIVVYDQYGSTADGEVWHFKTNDGETPEPPLPTPGFELILFIISMLFIIVIIRKKYNYNRKKRKY